MISGISKKLNIGVIGGSIAGLTAAITLREKGHTVTVLERSRTALNHRGAGIGLPIALVEQCIARGLFDSEIPRLLVSKRSFLMKDLSLPESTRSIWQQPLLFVPFNWGDIYSNLRKRIPDENYLLNQEVLAVREAEQKCYVETDEGAVFEFDRVIGADGVGSFLRQALFPDIAPSYTDYVAWRGIVDAPEIVEQDCFNGHAPAYMFPNGHLLFYQIPAPDYALTKRTQLNWVMYEHQTNLSISEWLKDKDGTSRLFSVPPGKLSDAHIHHLHELANAVLPPPIAEIIYQTKTPFLQAIFDYETPSYVKGRTCLLGDAAGVLRPHSASGVLRALEGSFSLAEALDPNKHSDFDASLLAWSNQQVELSHKQCTMAKLMGRALVTEPPDWSRMDNESTSQWWGELMQGKTWYATSSSSAIVQSDLSPKPFLNQFTMQSQVDSLAESLQRVSLEEEKAANLPSPR